jgi:membrane protein implicated in regulation of membrane protease activity
MMNGIGYPIFWLILSVVLVALEAATMSIITIWFAMGALVAMIVAVMKFGLLVQATAFIIASAALLIFTRPIVKSQLAVKKEGTNADRVIGEFTDVTETINNAKFTGKVNVFGMEWTARSQDDKEIEVGKRVKVLEISGVKLIVEEVKD